MSGSETVKCCTNSTMITVKVTDERGKWRSKNEYLLSALGYAIGIGNVWRFPYLCYRNGGGAFLVPYLTMLVVCGIPLYFLESCWGQFGSLGCIKMFKMSPLFKGTGYAIIIVNVLCSVYYNVVISYPLLFLIKTASWDLPWENCNNVWNTDKCFKLDSTTNATSYFTQNSQLSFGERYRTPADEFFHNNILKISSGIESPDGIVWPLFFCNVASWIIIFLCIQNGVKSVGKVIYFTATFPFILLTVLFIRGITLPGAIDGIKFYISPQWDQLGNLKVWADAAIQIFFSLGPGWGGIVNMSSYNRFRNNTLRDSFIVPIMNCGTSIFAGFVVFSVLGYMSAKTGLPVSSVASAGPALAFVTYPEAIAMLPLPQLWAVLFFAMLYFLGVDTLFVQIESVISALLDVFPQGRKHHKTVAFTTCFFLFLASISCVTRGGMYVLQLFDWYVASVSVILICTIETLIVGWVYGVDNFIRDIEFMINEKVHWCWRFCWKYITPAILIFLFFTSIIFNTEVTYDGKIYPKWSIYIGWCLSLLSISMIPIFMIVKVASDNTGGTLRQRIKRSAKAKNWKPMCDDDAMAWNALLIKK